MSKIFSLDSSAQHYLFTLVESKAKYKVYGETSYFQIVLAILEGNIIHMSK